ncbi:MAG: hypothetical protein QOG10_5810, partial [Kribbellaceae bacterium]|nr:hypothetical protein [Kribbellaceae bacterium]
MRRLSRISDPILTSPSGAIKVPISYPICWLLPGACGNDRGPSGDLIDLETDRSSQAHRCRLRRLARRVELQREVTAMTRFLRNRAMRGILAGALVAAVLPVGSAATSSAAREPHDITSARSATTSASATAASISTPASVTTAASPSLGPAGAAAQKPYMGWSSYSMQVYSNDGGNWISAAQIIAQSDAMHKKLQPYGFKYINIDAAWNGGTDEYGRPVPSKKLYPNGLQEVINHIHANGQKVGLYSIPGISKAMLDANLPVYGHP